MMYIYIQYILRKWGVSVVDFFEPLYGNGQLKAYISAKIADGALPHALILEGSKGSGKLTAALMTAMSLSPEYASKIKKLGTPDVTLHEPQDGKKSIGVALIREIRQAAFIKPQELDCRVFIIRHAHLMTTEAQNALLKILEEPPKGVYFLLLCENASLLLPTVRSRAPVLKMSVFSDEELSEYMLSTSKKAEVMHKSSLEDYQLIIRLCSGSIGQALEKIGTPAADAEKTRKRVKELITYLGENKRDRILLFFVKEKNTREELDSVLLGLSGAMRDMLKLKYGSLDLPLYFTSLTDADEMSALFARSTLMSIYTQSEALRAKLSINVNIEAFSARCADLLTDAAAK